MIKLTNMSVHWKVVHMISRFFILVVFIVLISGCENKEDKLFSLSSMIEEKKPIGFIDIRANNHSTNANEEAKTSNQKKIDEFESIVSDIKLKQVEKSQITELNKEYASKDNLLTVAIANSMNSKNVLFIDLTNDGTGLVVSFENGGSTDEMYEIYDSDPDLYEAVYGFYESIYKEVSIEPK